MKSSLKLRQAIGILAIIVGVTCLFENCGKVNFGQQGAAQLSSGTDTTAGTPETAPPPGMTQCDPIMSGTNEMCQKSPVSDPNQCIPQSGTGSNNSYNQRGLCFLTDGPGESDRIGTAQSQTVQVLDVAQAVSKDVCMSPNACLNLINAYLNETGGNLDGVPGTAPSKLTAFTSFADHTTSICLSNPNVVELTDAQVSADLANLAAQNK